MSGEIERWISSKEISQYLGINKDTLQRWISKRLIPCHRIGRLWKFKISEVDEWIKKNDSSKVE